MPGIICTTDPYCDVRTEKVQVAGQEVAKTAVQVRDQDGVWQLAGIQGPEYQLLTNSKAKDIMDDVKTRSNHEWTDIKTIWDGKKYAQFSRTQDKITSISNGQEHDLYMGLLSRNSYDGSGSYGFGVFAFNFSCANQYISRNRFGYYVLRHTPGQMNDFDIQDAVKNIGHGAQAILDVAPKIQDLRNTGLTTEKILEARKSTAIPSSKWGTVLDELDKEEDNNFGLFQAMTNVTTHHLSGFNSINIGDGVTDYFLKAA